MSSISSQQACGDVRHPESFDYQARALFQAALERIDNHLLGLANPFLVEGVLEKFNELSSSAVRLARRPLLLQQRWLFRWCCWLAKVLRAKRTFKLKKLKERFENNERTFLKI